MTSDSVGTAICKELNLANNYRSELRNSLVGDPEAEAHEEAVSGFLVDNHETQVF